MKIQFIKSPTGKPWNLAYFPGDIVDMPEDKAQALIQDGYANAYVSPKAVKADGANAVADSSVKKAVSEAAENSEKR